MLDFPALKVYIPEPDYLLAMKASAPRVDTQDATDIRFLINHLGLTTAEEIFDIIENYYPRQQIRPVTRYFIEEIME